MFTWTTKFKWYSQMSAYLSKKGFFSLEELTNKFHLPASVEKDSWFGTTLSWSIILRWKYIKHFQYRQHDSRSIVHTQLWGFYATSQMGNLSYTKVKIFIFTGDCKIVDVILKIKSVNINFKNANLLLCEVCSTFTEPFLRKWWVSTVVIGNWTNKQFSTMKYSKVEWWIFLNSFYEFAL